MGCDTRARGREAAHLKDVKAGLNTAGPAGLRPAPFGGARLPPHGDTPRGVHGDGAVIRARAIGPGSGGAPHQAAHKIGVRRRGRQATPRLPAPTRQGEPDWNAHRHAFAGPCGRVPVPDAHLSVLTPARHKCPIGGDTRMHVERSVAWGLRAVAPKCPEMNRRLATAGGPMVRGPHTA